MVSCSERYGEKIFSKLNDIYFAYFLKFNLVYLNVLISHNFAIVFTLIPKVLLTHSVKINFELIVLKMSVVHIKKDY